MVRVTGVPGTAALLPPAGSSNIAGPAASNRLGEGLSNGRMSR